MRRGAGGRQGEDSCRIGGDFDPIAADVDLRRWLDEWGISAAEAGRIPPSHGFNTRAEACFCNRRDDAIGVIEATYLAGGGAEPRPGDDGDT